MAKDQKHSEEPKIEELSGDQLDDVQGGGKGGNVEYSWKIEEGTVVSSGGGTSKLSLKGTGPGRSFDGKGNDQ